MGFHTLIHHSMEETRTTKHTKGERVEREREENSLLYLYFFFFHSCIQIDEYMLYTAFMHSHDLYYTYYIK